jgi:hypothetical protein
MMLRVPALTARYRIPFSVKKLFPHLIHTIPKYNLTPAVLYSFSLAFFLSCWNLSISRQTEVSSRSDICDRTDMDESILR